MAGFEGTPLLGPGAENAQRMGEAIAGMRCDGCGERIGSDLDRLLGYDAPGLEYVAFRALVEDGRPTMLTERRFACSREGCADFHDELRSQAVAVRPITGWSFLDGDG